MNSYTKRGGAARRRFCVIFKKPEGGGRKSTPPPGCARVNLGTCLAECRYMNNVTVLDCQIIAWKAWIWEVLYYVIIVYTKTRAHVY